jgi:hypothetical protein
MPRSGGRNQLGGDGWLLKAACALTKDAVFKLSHHRRNICCRDLSSAPFLHPPPPNPPRQVINRWLSVRLELLGISVVFGTAVAVAVAAPRSAGLAGLALTSALNLTGLMNWMVRQTTELEVGSR